MWKFCEKAQFPDSFDTRKLSEITVFYAIENIGQVERVMRKCNGNLCNNNIISVINLSSHKKTDPKVLESLVTYICDPLSGTINNHSQILLLTADCL